MTIADLTARRGEREDIMKYEVFWVAGKRDGETLATFDDVADAINFASDFYEKHQDEFDETWGGVAIIDENGKDIEW